MHNYISIGRTEANKFTGNHCISHDQYLNHSKPFKFKFENGMTVTIPNNVIRNYVRQHPSCWRRGFNKTDADGNKFWVSIPFVLIPDRFILSYAA